MSSICIFLVIIQFIVTICFISSEWAGQSILKEKIPVIFLLLFVLTGKKKKISEEDPVCNYIVRDNYLLT